MSMPLQRPLHRSLRVFQRGFTIVEILVSIAIMLIVTLATIGLFNTTSESYRTVDADQELQNSGRFALDQLGYAVRHAGYQERMYQPKGWSDVTDLYFSGVKKAIEAVDNAALASTTSDTDFGSETSNNGINASDIFTVRFFGAGATIDSTDPSKAMQNCMGTSLPYPIGQDALIVSSFFVKVTDNEPELHCKFQSYISATNSPGAFTSQPIVRGVETFQVLLGVSASNTSTVVVKWVTPDAVTAAEWQQVMAVRFGLVIRGALGSAPAPVTAIDYYPFGKDFANGSTAASFKFTAPIDTRLRRVFTASFKIRNHTVEY